MQERVRRLQRILDRGLPPARVLTRLRRQAFPTNAGTVYLNQKQNSKKKLWLYLMARHAAKASPKVRWPNSGARLLPCIRMG